MSQVFYSNTQPDLFSSRVMKNYLEMLDSPIQAFQSVPIQEKNIFRIFDSFYQKIIKPNKNATLFLCFVFLFLFTLYLQKLKKKPTINKPFEKHQPSQMIEEDDYDISLEDIFPEEQKKNENNTYYTTSSGLTLDFMRGDEKHKFEELSKVII